ncbi:RimK family alpha-L-glutamate ligase [Microvirga sp. 2MCAF35]|uniref:ATP-grasp domain-containing protein n=1 Tax=Microvirga sp. 2MCAF35 TaxID=3232987 RepID=UPI003F960DFC
MRRKVIVLAQYTDLHADAVIDWCRQLGMEPLRICPEDIISRDADFLLTVMPHECSWRIETGSIQISSNEDFTVFCRDWEVPTVQSTEDLERSVALEEGRAALFGWLASIPADRCLDHPFIQQRFDSKIVQVGLAKQVGLSVPQTVVTNDPSQAQQFLTRHRSVIKLMSNVSFVGLEGQGEFVYTSAVNDEHLNELGEIRNCPVLLQQAIEKVGDVRVTVVGEQVFPALITAPDPMYKALDFRAMPSERVERFDLDPITREAVIKLNRAMGLRFSAMDFGLLSNGELIFFEANVAGNWLWIEKETGLEITSEIARELNRLPKKSDASRQMDLP